MRSILSISSNSPLIASYRGSGKIGPGMQGVMHEYSLWIMHPISSFRLIGHQT